MVARLYVGLRTGQFLGTAGRFARLLLALEDLAGHRLHLAGHHLRQLPPHRARRARERAATQRTVAGASPTAGTVDAYQAMNLV